MWKILVTDMLKKKILHSFDVKNFQFSIHGIQ